MVRDFDRLQIRFRQFGGWRLVWQYTKMGVLWTGVRELADCVIHGRSFKRAYPVIIRGVDKRLLKQYHSVFDALNKKRADGIVSSCGEKKAEERKPKIAWVIWLQGIDHAPEMVRMCIASQKSSLPDYEFHFVSETNYKEWITLPRHIEEKRGRGIIPDAQFSDLLRLALLVRYGGLYMDATVLCTGFGNERLHTRWTEIELAGLFIFRYFRHGERVAHGLSNWFISARPCHPVLLAVNNALLEYWRDYDCLVNYYVMHLFLGEALRRFPEILETMPRGNSFHSLLLGGVLAKDFDAAAWQELTEHVSFHKLNFRKAKDAERNPYSFYNRIFKNSI